MTYRQICRIVGMPYPRRLAADMEPRRHGANLSPIPERIPTYSKINGRLPHKERRPFALFYLYPSRTLDTVHAGSGMDNVQHLYPAISDPINDQMRIQDNVSVHPAFGFSGTPPSIPQTHDSLYPTA